MKKFGLDLLVDQVADSVSAQVSEMAAAWSCNDKVWESPIERLFELALYCQIKFGEQIWLTDIVVPPNVDLAKEDHDAYKHLLLQRQVTIIGVGRVDFLIHAYGQRALDPDGGLTGWRKLIVECDGHEFHERTKKQAAKDRSRDRAATLNGIEVFRFTGSELWRDPWGCAKQVIDWADRGF